MPTVRELLGDEVATLQAQGKTDDEIITIAQARYHNQKEESSIAVNNNVSNTQEHTIKQSDCNCYTSGEIVGLLVPATLLVVLLIFLVKSIKSVLSFLMDSTEEKLASVVKKLVVFIYIAAGVLIFTVMPQYFTESYQYTIYGKFAFVWNVKSVDYIMMGFEIVGYLIMGVALYFFLYKLCKIQKNKSI